MEWPRPTASGLLPVTLPLVLALLSACDFFATKEFSPKPASLSAFSGAFGSDDTLTYRVTESLAKPGSEASDTVLSILRLRFLRAPDSLQGGDGWTAVSVLILSDPPGTYRDEGVIRVRVDAEGLLLQGSDSAAGGARFFPLKIAVGGSADPIAAPFAPPGDSAAEFLALPAVFNAGAAWTQPMGVLEVEREFGEVDTLTYRNRLEECWRVAETIRDGSKVLSEGRFWYGESGLLKGEQIWAFEGRTADGFPMPEGELRRELERL